MAVTLEKKGTEGYSSNCLCQKIEIIKPFIFNSTFWFFTGPMLNEKYDSLSNLDEVIISLGTVDRQTWKSGHNGFLQN